MCFELENQPWSRFGETDNGHHRPKSTRVGPTAGLGGVISERGTRLISGKSSVSRTYDYCGDSGHDHLHDLSYSLWVPRRDLCTSHYARESSRHSAVSSNNTARYRYRCGLSFDLSGICDQYFNPAFSLVHSFVLPRFLCPPRPAHSRCCASILRYVRGRSSLVGSPCISRNQCERYP